MALGTGAFVEFTDGDKVNIDYVRADLIYPLRAENGEILDCAFASEHQTGKDKFVYLNIYTKETNKGIMAFAIFILGVPAIRLKKQHCPRASLTK